ncbi:hypothetical protein R6Q59_037192 [Mikania micrantha]|uniref:VQ domain-containing protein n=1 Tax=Mikania micrantha TaxID=192012 RepID=A0A5N6ME32_9ASTR|nr:hypothetical protein E3N88_34197 [Mikania micrantha]
MDSSNSGSFQSSSGGAGGGAGDTDEYDSTTQSISSFFNPSTNFNPANLNHLLQPPPTQPSSNHTHHHPPPTDHNTFYNSSSTQPFSPNTNTIQDPASAWTGNMRPDQNLADYGNYRITHSQHGSDHHRRQIGVTIKNPKKRTRASRRAPTTVLTTDTTNFRQMVQEFTGIPTGPFTTAPFSRRLDLFGRGSDGAAGSLQTLRPSAQKIQPQPTPFLNSGANIVESGTSNNTTSATTSGNNYKFAPSNTNDFQKQASSFLDLQNPMFSFQSLLQNSLPQQSNGLQNSSKRWRDENGKLEGFEGVIGNTQNVGGSKLNSGIENVLISSRNGGDQVQGNEDSWICPSS